MVNQKKLTRYDEGYKAGCLHERENSKSEILMYQLILGAIFVVAIILAIVFSRGYSYDELHTINKVGNYLCQKYNVTLQNVTWHQDNQGNFDLLEVNCNFS